MYTEGFHSSMPSIVSVVSSSHGLFPFLYTVFCAVLEMVKKVYAALLLRRQVLD